MTPLLRLLLPVAVAAAAGIAVARIDWRRYPAWFSAMCWQVFIHAATRGSKTFPVSIIPISTAIVAWMILEGAACSREQIAPNAAARGFSAALCASAVLSALAAGLSLSQQAFLFRSYFLWIAALSLVALCALRIVCPVLERPCDRIERWGVALWVLGMAMQGAFVTGGIGYAIFGSSAAVRNAVGIGAYLWVSILLPGMSLAMAQSAPGRKRGAKRPDGKTVTGLIEMAAQKAA